MDASHAARHRLYTGLSEYLGTELAEELVAALPIREELVTKTDLRDFGDALIDRIDSRFEKIDSRFERVDDRFARIDDRFDRLQARFDRLYYLTFALLIALIGWLFFQG